LLPVVLLLFLQWPLRDLVRAWSRDANDLAQWLFALYVAMAFTAAMRRPTDLTARYGGEEFVALLGDTDTEGALRVADAMRKKVEQLMIAHGGSSHPCVTVSCGVAVAVPSDDSSAEDLVMRADRKLYEAKAAGRNRIAN